MQGRRPACLSARDCSRLFSSSNEEQLADWTASGRLRHAYSSGWHGLRHSSLRIAFPCPCRDRASCLSARSALGECSSPKSIHPSQWYVGIRLSCPGALSGKSSHLRSLVGPLKSRHAPSLGIQGRKTQAVDRRGARAGFGCSRGSTRTSAQRAGSGYLPAFQVGSRLRKPRRGSCQRYRTL
jgi:hypothetical protein